MEKTLELSEIPKENQPNKQNANDTIEEFLRKRRNNPYYYVISVLFAYIVGQIGLWTQKMILDILDPKAATTELPGKLATLLLAFAVFYLVIALWLFFSRVLVFHVESFVGEGATFLLGFGILEAVYILGEKPEWFGYVLAACMGLLVGKNIMVAYMLRKTHHPLRLETILWARNALAYGIILYLGQKYLLPLLLSPGKHIYIARLNKAGAEMVLKFSFNIGPSWWIVVIGILTSVATLLCIRRLSGSVGKVYNDIRVFASEHPEEFNINEYQGFIQGGPQKKQSFLQSFLVIAKELVVWCIYALLYATVDYFTNLRLVGYIKKVFASED